MFRESLAGSLASFGIRLTETKDFETALSADREAVSIYTALPSLDPEGYQDPLEGAVRNLAIHLRDLRRGEQEIADELDSLLSVTGLRHVRLTKAVRTATAPQTAHSWH